jgi:Hydrophobic surface binding protein A
MHFKTISTVAFMVLAAVATPLEAVAYNTLVAFDLPTVQASFNQIQASIDKMITKIKDFDGETEKMEPMLSAATEILNGIKEGTSKIASSPTMGIMDALGMLTPVGTMASKVDEVVAALTAKKEVFDKLAITAVVVEQLQDQLKASDQMSKAIAANLPMPALLGPIAGPIGKLITDKLEAGIRAFGAEPVPLTGSAPTPSSAKSGKSPKSGRPGKGGKSPGFVRDILVTTENMSIDELV